MTHVTIYTKPMCVHCARAKRRLRRRAAVIREVRAAGDTTRMRSELRERFGVDSFPQIVIGEQHIGGADDLVHLDRTGELQRLLANRKDLP